MKLAAKLVSLILLGVIAIIAFDGYLSFKREVELFDTDMERDAQLLGRSLSIVLNDVWRFEGPERAMQLIADANRGEHLLRIRWVWLDAGPGESHAPQIPRGSLERVARGESVSLPKRAANGALQLLTYVPVEVGAGRLGALELAEPSSARDAYLRSSVIRTFVLTGSLILVSSVLTALLGVAIVGRPLRRLSEKAGRIGAGDLSGPLPLRGRDELSALAAAVNRMCEQIEEGRAALRAEVETRVAAERQLRHADRLKTVGTLAAGLAHELGTPLNVVAGRARLIESGDLSGDEVAESAKIVRGQSERMTAILRQLLDFSRRPSLKRSDVDLRRLVERSLKLLAPNAQKRKATLCLVGEDSRASAWANPDEIQQVLTNLVVNAVQAMPQGGTVEVGIRHERAAPPAGYEGSEGEWLCLSVRDEGEGIPGEELERIFDPFFTTKDVGQATGLGLSIAQGIVRDNGGWIQVASEVGKGSCFSVYLPQEGSQCRAGS